MKIYPHALLLFIMTCLSACGIHFDGRPSVLVIAVENLSFDSVSCGSDQIQARDMMAFRTFCEESVRFTHAFTSSVQSQAALASIMTGLYPIEHAVHDNGTSFLSAKFNTLAEGAAEKGYRTSFFSGGPPIWRKSGLAQGFEVFDDNIRVTPTTLYRAALPTLQAFMSWLHDEIGKTPFLSFIFLADLQFPQVTTTNDLGEIRERSKNSQLHEVGESLGVLVNHLKRIGRWDSTYVILVGTKGSPDSSRNEEIETLSLLSANTQVALFIKPASKARDLGLEWKIDKNVSLVDIAPTIGDIIGWIPEPSQFASIPAFSLKGALEKPNADWPSDRHLLVESGWAKWRNLGETRFSIRKDQYLYVLDQKPKLYNSLIDRMEATPFAVQDPLYQEIEGQFKIVEKELKLNKFSNLNSDELVKLQFANSLWLNGLGMLQTPVWENKLKDKTSLPELNGSWLALTALENKDWNLLEALALKQRRVSWLYVARRNQGKKVVWRPQGCFSLLPLGVKALDKVDFQSCIPEGVLPNLKWLIEKDEERINSLRAEFIRKYTYWEIDRNIYRLSLSQGRKWDNVENPKLLSPQVLDLFLTLPEGKKVNHELRANVSWQDDGL